MKKQFTSFQGTAIPLPIENIDTDQIIPARFLKAISREGFGENLFRDWRFNRDNSVKNDFVLNQNEYTGQILVAGKNFGCGSSREHAAWAIADYGFKVVISSFFADIFKNNALNNGILPIAISDKDLQQLFTLMNENKSLLLSVNLEKQTLEFDKQTLSFEINPYKKMCLQKGYDNIDYLISQSEAIKAYESK